MGTECWTEATRRALHDQSLPVLDDVGPVLGMIVFRLRRIDEEPQNPKTPKPQNPKTLLKIT